MNAAREVSRYAAAALFCVAGVLHFVVPGVYVRIMPPALPFPLFLIYLSGAAEVVGGLGLLSRGTRRFASWGLIALLIAVFPANVFMALRPDLFPAIPAALLWGRLPLQGVLIWWLWRVGAGRKK